MFILTVKCLYKKSNFNANVKNLQYKPVKWVAIIIYSEK